MKIISLAEVEELVEKTLSKNDYTSELEFKDHLASIALLLRLLYMKESTYPDIPDLYFDIESRRHFANTGENVSKLESKLNNLITAYLPDLDIRLVEIKKIDDIEGLDYMFEIDRYYLSVQESVVDGVLDITNFNISEKDFNA